MFSAQRHLSLIFQNFKISIGNSSRIEILGISVGSKMAFWAKPSGPPSAVSQPPTSLPTPFNYSELTQPNFFNCFHKNLRYSGFNPKYDIKQRFNQKYIKYLKSKSFIRFPILGQIKKFRKHTGFEIQPVRYITVPLRKILRRKFIFLTDPNNRKIRKNPK